MTDKEKIREEVARIQLYSQSEVLKQILDFIDSLQEEPVKIKKGCKYRCLSDMVNKDTGNISFIGDKIYLAPKDNTLVSEENGWLCDTSENASNFELVEEPVSEEFEEALAREWQGYNDRGAATVDALEDNTQELAFAKGFYRGAKWQKEQMMKEIVAEQECKCMQITHRIIGGSWNLTCPTDKMGLKDGDKVKIKIIK